MNEDISLLFLSGENKELDEDIVRQASMAQDSRVHFGDLRNAEESYVELFENERFDALITVYWPFIVPLRVFSMVPLTVNFHPALLPINRGWYPHVHSILDGSPAGVTLHQLSAKADQGGIWAQHPVNIEPWETSGDVYKKLQREMFSLFCDSWKQIKGGEITPRGQNESLAIYHSKKEIDSLDKLDLDQVTKCRDFLNHLRARTFNNKGFAYFIEENQKYYVRVIIERAGGT